MTDFLSVLLGRFLVVQSAESFGRFSGSSTGREEAGGGEADWHQEPHTRVSWLQYIHATRTDFMYKACTLHLHAQPLPVCLVSVALRPSRA